MCSFLLNRLFYGFWIDATEMKMLGYEMESLAITRFLNSAQKRPYRYMGKAETTTKLDG
jgi:hypothetical protein